MSDINRDRLLADLKALAAIGSMPGAGVNRLAWSDADLAGRRWFEARIRDAGLEARVDEALNVFGHVPGARGPFLLTGSHLDTVPDGGRLDGAYGAVAALEVLRTLFESDDPLAECVEIAGFADEEGVRFSIGLLGSLALAGELPLDQLRDAADLDGRPIDEVLSQAGTELERMAAARAHLSSIKTFLELHIEQGPRMESAGLDLAVVTGIVGVHRQEIRIRGTQNHAGTTPFDLRHDAGRAAARAAAGLEELVQGIDGDAVANIGAMRFMPGGVNVIPGEAIFTLEVRHLDQAIVKRITDAFARRVEAICIQEGCTVEAELLSWVAPAPMDTELMPLIESACADLGVTLGRLWSGAGHDAAILSRHVPTGMLFVPSIGGISHAPEEATSDTHLVLGTRALLRAVRAASAQIK